jgi:hypothetical protein
LRLLRFSQNQTELLELTAPHDSLDRELPEIVQYKDEQGFEEGEVAVAQGLSSHPSDPIGLKGSPTNLKSIVEEQKHLSTLPAKQPMIESSGAEEGPCLVFTPMNKNYAKPVAHPIYG